YVQHKRDEGVLEGADKELVAEAERLEVRNMAPLILSELLLDENIRDQLKKYKRHFLRFCHRNLKAQKYLLGGFECVVRVHRDQLLPKVAHVLKDMYDSDLLEEEAILGWHDKVSKKYVSKELAKDIRTKAAPFVNWLKEAEEESEDGEDDEDDDDKDVEVVYDEKTTHLKVETIKKPVQAEEEADVDIDAI
uniref:Eukaryotic translation initiation factor 5 n=1 Tax=Petromyzon marinus TaxID=7757 RepID=S4REZ5_PETMA